MESNTQQVEIPMPDEIVEMESNTQQVEIPMSDEIDEMESNTQQIVIPTDGSSQKLKIPMPDEIDEVGKCCIYTVPEFIKKGKEECYRPLVISIGPVFYKDPKLGAMQELKKVYLKCFIEDSNNASQSLEPYNNFVREHESEIRECYQLQISLPSDKFIKMIVLDAAFLIFLFMDGICDSHHPALNTHLDTIENKLQLLRKFIGRDVLCVEENQLPFFVLKHFYERAFGKRYTHPSFLKLSLLYIRCSQSIMYEVMESIIIDEIILPNASSIKHLVHLQRMCCCLRFSHRPRESKSKSKSKSEAPDFHDFYSAKQLKAAGVIFKVNESDDPFDITFDKSNGVLKIPNLTLYDETEAFFRNILFFEQCHVQMDKYFTDYVALLDKLIDTVEDIQLLQQNEILRNELGSNEDAVDLFNKLCKNIFIDPSNFAYSDASKDLKEYASTNCNRWKAIFWSKYFNHPWAIISVIYAIILLILTVVQTISGFTSK